MDIEEIKPKINRLPMHLKREVINFIDFLLKKHSNQIEKYNFRFDWEGGLSDLDEKYTSVELQHKASELR